MFLQAIKNMLAYVILWHSYESPPILYTILFYLQIFSTDDFLHLLLHHIFCGILPTSWHRWIAHNWRRQLYPGKWYENIHQHHHQRPVLPLTHTHARQHGGCQLNIVLFVIEWVFSHFITLLMTIPNGWQLFPIETTIKLLACVINFYAKPLDILLPLQKIKLLKIFIVNQLIKWKKMSKCVFFKNGLIFITVVPRSGVTK